MQLICNTLTLNEFCKIWAEKDFIAVDLEFVREKTYYPIPCLIQVAADDEAVIIDPMAPDLDMKEFFKLLQNKKVVKVFHSCRQDVEILFRLSGKVPQPIFDTQVAAMVCGYGESVGYERLVKEVLGVELDKSECLSNWQLRPLNTKQLEYACGDVTYLVKLYQSLSLLLKKTGRESWIKEEMEYFADPQTYLVNPDEIWQKIKFKSHNAKALSNLRDLAAWRERRAQEKNVPRPSVVKDELLAMIAANSPKNKDELMQIRGMRRDFAFGKLGDEVMIVLAKVKVDKKIAKANEKEEIKACHALAEILRLLLKIVSQEQKVVARLVASDTDIMRLAAFDDANNPVLQGWRYEIFGQKAVALRAGKTAIVFDPKKKKINFVEQA